MQRISPPLCSSRAGSRLGKCGGRRRSLFVEMTVERTGHVTGAEQSTDLRAKNAGHQFFPNALRSTSQVVPVAMSFSHNLSSGPRLSSAIVMM
jgi:hypothetical protein